jgi:hypothetical protein
MGLVAPAVFRSQRIRCDEARVADAFWARAFQSNPSLAFSAYMAALRPCVRLAWRTARRSVALTRTSSIARAGETGETDPRRDIHQAGTPAARCSRHVVTLARDPYHSSVVAKTPPPATGHSPNRAFFAWRSATRLGLLALSCGAFYRRRTEPSRCLAGRRRSSLLLFAVRRRSWGSTTPFAGFIPQPGGHASLASRGGHEHTVVLIASTFLPVRAHVPFVPPVSAPIDFRRGDRSPVGVTRSAKAIGRGCGWHRLLGFCSRLRSVTSAHVWLKQRSCHGLCLLQGCRAHSPCIGRARPRYRSPAPGPPSANSFAAGDSYPLMGLATFIPITPAVLLRASCRPARLRA